MKYGFWFSFLFLFSGCATSTPYQKANYLGYGYTSTLIDKNTARVGFKGNKLTDRADVELMLLYRAAEVSQDNGFQYFKLSRLQTDRQSEAELMTPRVPYFQYRRDGRVRYRRSSVRGQPSESFITYNQFEAVSFIHMANKKKSDDYYSAEETLKNLKSEIKFDN